MPRPVRRKVPRSRRELRESGTPTIPHTVPTPPAIVAPSTAQLPRMAPIVAPIVAPTSLCLYTPYECSVYRFPPQWCSMCQVKAASLCAQIGQPDIRMVFNPCAQPMGASCVAPCYQAAACPTSVVSYPPVSPAHCPTPKQCTL